MFDLHAYGLGELGVLQVATELAPELFAALLIARDIDDSSFPLETDHDIERLLANLAGNSGEWTTAGVRITPEDARDRFPAEFLPVTDRADLIRKSYMAIVISHQTEARESVQNARLHGVHADHPFDIEVL